MTNNYSSNTILADMYRTASGSRPAGLHYNVWWGRSSHPGYAYYFFYVSSIGTPDYNWALDRLAVVPAFSF